MIGIGCDRVVIGSHAACLKLKYLVCASAICIICHKISHVYGKISIIGICASDHEEFSTLQMLTSFQMLNDIAAE